MPSLPDSCARLQVPDPVTIMYEVAALFRMGRFRPTGAAAAAPAARPQRKAPARVYLVEPQRQLQFNILHRGHFRGKANPVLLVEHIASRFYLNPWRECFHHQLPRDLACRFHAFVIAVDGAMDSFPPELVRVLARSFWGLFKASIDDETIQVTLHSQQST